MLNRLLPHKLISHSECTSFEKGRAFTAAHVRDPERPHTGSRCQLVSENQLKWLGARRGSQGIYATPIQNLDEPVCNTPAALDNR